MTSDTQFSETGDRLAAAGGNAIRRQCSRLRAAWRVLILSMCAGGVAAAGSGPTASTITQTNSSEKIGFVEVWLTKPAAVTNLVFHRVGADPAMAVTTVRATWQEGGFYAQISPQGAVSQPPRLQAGFQSFRYWFETNNTVYVWDDTTLTGRRPTNYVYALIEHGLLRDLEAVLSLGIPDVEPGFTAVESDKTTSITKSGVLWHGRLGRDPHGRVARLDLFYDRGWRKRAFEIGYEYGASSALDSSPTEINRRVIDDRAPWGPVRYEIKRFEVARRALLPSLFNFIVSGKGSASIHQPLRWGKVAA